MTEEELSQILLEAPPGSFSLKVDGQGRLAIPREWDRYFARLDEKEFFITFEKGWLKIFPRKVWFKQNATAFREKSEEDYEDWSITMQHYGVMTGFDKEYRLTPSQTLRTAMNLKGAELIMMNHQGTLRGMLKTDYEQRQRDAEAATNKQQSRPDGPRML
ncbi:MAG: hypothetical protein NTV52_30890 [Acidobacteria bacterium]|nr:hypothetical protein [Acidobacteriota bacterium]